MVNTLVDFILKFGPPIKKVKNNLGGNTSEHSTLGNWYGDRRDGKNYQSPEPG